MLDQMLKGDDEPMEHVPTTGFGNLSTLSEVSEVGFKRPRDTMDTLYESEGPGSRAIRPLPIVSSQQPSTENLFNDSDLGTGRRVCSGCEDTGAEEENDGTAAAKLIESKYPYGRFTFCFLLCACNEPIGM